MNRQPRGLMALIFAAPLIAVTVLIDQLSKNWALTATGGNEGPFAFNAGRNIPLIDFQFHWNTNAALSIPIPGPFWFEIALIIAIMLFVAGWLWREGGRQNAIGFGLILGGALGNLIDRLVHHAVVDFLKPVIPIPGYGPFMPFIFNIADAALTLGVIWLFVEQLILRPRRTAQAVVS